MKENLIIKYEDDEVRNYKLPESYRERKLFDDCFSKDSTKKIKYIKFFDLNAYYDFNYFVEQALNSETEKNNFKNKFSKIETIDYDISIIKKEKSKIQKLFQTYPITEIVISDNNSNTPQKIKTAFFRDDDSIKYQKNNFKKISIADSVTELGSNFFENCTKIEEIKLPNQLKYISNSTFKNCTSLKKITIPNSVTTIEEDAFRSCDSLEEIILPDSITKIGEYCFDHCNNLKKIKLPNNLNCIESYTFRSCDSLEEIILPDSITKIGQCCFEYCNNLKKIKLPNNLNCIEFYTFGSCISLEEIILPDSITKIGNSCFRDCNNLKKIKLPNNLNCIERDTFCGCVSLEEIILPNSITKIGDTCFYCCRNLKSITIPDSITSIKALTFYECDNLKYIKMSKNITKIEKNAFAFCNSLQELELELENINTFDKSLSAIIDGITMSNIEFPTLIINYNSIETLINQKNSLCEFIKKNNYLSKNLNKFKNIIFIGPKIPSFHQNAISNVLNEVGTNNFIFKEKINSTKNNEYEKKSIPNNDNLDIELLDLTNKIEEIIKKLPENSKEHILNIRNKIISNYLKEKHLEKPTLNLSLNQKNLIDLNHKPNIIGNAKITAIVELNNLLFSLSRQEKLLKSLEEINKYREILQMEVHNLNNNPNTIEQLLENFKYITTKVPNFKKEEIKEELNRLLTIQEQEYQKELNIDINQNLTYNLSLNSSLEPKLQLHHNLQQFYENIISYYNNIKPFLELFNALNVEEVNNIKYLEEDTIEGIIYKTNLIITKLKNEENKNELKNKFSIIKNKYKDTINHSILNKNITNEKYKEIVLNLRTELQYFLQDLNLIATKEESQDKVLKQFQDSLVFIEKYDLITQKIATSATELFIIDIFNCLKEPYFNNDDRDAIKEKTYEIINEAIILLKSTTTEEKAKELEKNTYKKLAELYLITSEYINKIQTYNKTYSENISSKQI